MPMRNGFLLLALAVSFVLLVFLLSYSIAFRSTSELSVYFLALIGFFFLSVTAFIIPFSKKKRFGQKQLSKDMERNPSPSISHPGIKNSQSLTPDETIKALDSSLEGLSRDEAENRLNQYGKNVLTEEKTSKLKIFVRQFNNILIYVLIAASVLTVLVGEWTDFAVILFIISVNGIIGFWQELKAETSLNALRKLTESKAKVKRDGQTSLVPSSELVPGDLVIVSEGDLVTADMRLRDSKGLTVDESTLTGESLPVLKDHSVVLPEKTLPYELRNLLLTGTAIVRGSGEAFVTKTGCSTYFASIAEGSY